MYRFIQCLAFVLIIGANSQAYAQTKAINKFYAKYDRASDDVTKLKLQRWMVGLGKMAIRISGENDDQTELALDLAKSIKKGKILVVEDSTQIHLEDIKQFKKELFEESYEELMTVHADGSKVNILIIEKDDLIRNIVLLVHEPDNLVMLSFKTKLSINDLVGIIQNYKDKEKKKKE